MRLTSFMDQLRLMESRGHAGRISHPTDGRSYRVVLTAAGGEAHRAANRQFEEAHRAVLAHLPHDEAAAQACLREVRGAADAAGMDFGAAVSPRRPVGRAG